MDVQSFWRLIDDARGRVSDGSDTDAVAEQAEDLLAALPPEQIAAADQVLWDLMALSYRDSLWAAAYIANGGCSDDGFDYFRGWLILQGRVAFDQAVADPDSLADLPAVRRAVADEADLEGETALNIASAAYTRVTGQQIPDRSAIAYPDQDPAWDFDFDDRAEMSRRLPRLAQLYEY